MNTPFQLSTFTPAEVLVLEKGFYTTRKELLRILLFHLECCGVLRLFSENEACYVELLNRNTSNDQDFQPLIDAATRSGSNRTLFSHYIRILAETVDEDKLIRSILRKLKKAGYYKQSIVGFITGQFDITEQGSLKRKAVLNELKQLKDDYKSNRNPTQLLEILLSLKGNSALITGVFPDAYAEFESQWQTAIWAIDTEKYKNRGGEGTSCGGGCSGLSGCGGSGCGGSGCGGGGCGGGGCGG